MVSINYSAREVCCKIVYYGPGLSGKTTNLQYVHAKVPGDTKGKLISLATEADRTLYFDFLPINIGTINGFQAKFQLYTVPGQVYYNATRKLVLRGVDGLVFVADSQPDKMDENAESLANLVENLSEYGYDVTQMPVVMQYNKRDLPGVLPVEELEQRLNKYGWPCYEASATIGNGVFDTLKLIIKLVLEKAKTASSTKIKSTESKSEPVQASEPVGAGVSGGPSAGQSSAESRDSSYRPYPGGATGQVPQATEAQSVSEVATDKEQPAATQPEVEESANENAESEVVNAASASNPMAAGKGSPRMAPSLRRRGEGKKRGFFKRLLGIR